MAASDLADPYIVNYVDNSAYSSCELHVALAFLGMGMLGFT